MKKNLIVILILGVSVDILYPQDKTALGDFLENHIDLWAMQPNSFVYFDIGPDDSTEIDIYQDGKAEIGAQLLGVDVKFGSLPATYGLSFGGGIDEVENSLALILQVSLYAQYKKAARLQLGVVLGLSAIEEKNFADKTDVAVFVGIGFPFDLLEEWSK